MIAIITLSLLLSPLIPQKVLRTFNAIPDPIQYPQYTTTAGSWLFFPPNTWTSGFFSATLYELNSRQIRCGTTPANSLGIADWLTLARTASAGLLPLTLTNRIGHDVGFLSFPFRDELDINPTNLTAMSAINNFARLLAARYSPIVRATRSWDASNPTVFRVIIDNMMNLQLFFQSYALTGNSTLLDIAIAHADTTLKNHIRDDGSTWHVVEYNATTGNVIRKRTAQGYSDDSTWSRGQAWGIYGFSTMYQHTHNIAYLETARRLAIYFLDNIPADGVVPWDFNAPLPRPADSSAAVIAANALLLLSKHETDALLADKWSQAAIEITHYTTALAWNPSWQSLLSNGTVNEPANNYLTGTVYGDYYFIKVGNELISQGKVSCS